MSDSDGMNELLDDTLRQAVMIAARIGEQVARHRQEQLRQARLISDQASRQAQARFEAERLSARTALHDVSERDWWKLASPEQIGAAYQTATAWKDHDPEIAAVRTVLDERLANRGIDTSSPTESLTELIRAREWAAQYEPQMSDAYTRDMITSPAKADRERMNNALVASYLARPESQNTSEADDERAAARGDRKEADYQRGAAGADLKEGDQLERAASARSTPAPVTVEELEQAQAWLKTTNPTDEQRTDTGLVQDWKQATGQLDTDAPDDRAATRADRAHDREPSIAAQQERKARVQFVDAGVSYDSAGRRQSFADRLDGKADQSDKRARMLADISQGTPAVAAVAGPRPNAPKAQRNTNVPNRQIRKGSR
ncbi:hypothetical protein ACL9RL_18400 [Plantibacter sp. Mn2098]|uniref:hypothetical protein n=1 Tax=Plantibacter sp. Mn2098 TaxID=3395266 RepID=UPI003BD870E4